MDREEKKILIRIIIHPGCTYHSKPVCPSKGNHTCMNCEDIVNKVMEIIEG